MTFVSFIDKISVDFAKSIIEEIQNLHDSAKIFRENQFNCEVSSKTLCGIAGD
jgi:hypothetical protein